MRVLKPFLNDESGAVSLDWLVLTAVIVGTGISIMSSVSGGVGTASLLDVASLRGQVVQRSFGSEDICAHGIDGLRAREAARIAAGGDDPVDVTDRLETSRTAFSDEALLRERDRLSRLSRDEREWTRQSTIRGLVECDLARRGLD